MNTLSPGAFRLAASARRGPRKSPDYIAEDSQGNLSVLERNGGQLAQAQCHTVRLKLLKIGAQIRITVRKIWVSMSTGYPYLDLFRRVYRNLEVIPLR